MLGAHMGVTADDGPFQEAPVVAIELRGRAEAVTPQPSRTRFSSCDANLVAYLEEPRHLL
jgi:hypothetical protein